jgi:sugar phosphate isomerase/epimerase
LAKRPFGVSTRLYGSQRLRREHLLEIAAHGFGAVEVVAARTHIDVHNDAAIADLQQWLAEAGLELHNVAVPAQETAENTQRALFIARRIPLKVLIVQATTPRETAKAVEKLATLAKPLGVTIAIDSASMSPIGSVAHFVERGVDAIIGICLDVAGAARNGDPFELVDAIETVAEHLNAVHVPFDGAAGGIDWPSALTTIQKVGYDGALMFDGMPRGSTKETLARAKAAREKMERWLTST